MNCVIIAASFLLFSLVQGQQQQIEGVDKGDLSPAPPGGKVDKARKQQKCSPDFRTLDGTCTNDKNETTQVWGATRRAQVSSLNVNSVEPKGQGLPSARVISNILFDSKRDLFDRRGLNEMVVFFAQLIDHTVVATPLGEGRELEMLNIDVPKDDPIFANFSSVVKGQLLFARSQRVPVKEGSKIERPINTLTSLIDLDSVYGAAKKRSDFLRTMKDGLMRTGPGDLLPRNRGGNRAFNNAPRAGRRFFIAGDHRSNEHPMLTSLHTLLLREHNSLAREIKQKLLPNGSDQMIFARARKINIGQMQKIVFKQWYRAMTGRDLPKYTGFKENTECSISVEFSTAAFRVGHTMIGNRINRLGPNKEKKVPFQFNEMLFRDADDFVDFEDFVRGALNNRAQRVDLEVRDSLRNFLFENTRGEDGADLISLNIQRGRDHAIPTYNELRKEFRKNVAYSFKDITENRNVQSALANAYGTVDKIEALPGLFAEDHAKGSSLGPTMLAIWEAEFTRVRDGDRFYYEAEGRFSERLLNAIPRARDLFNDNVDTLRDIIVRNSNVSPKDIPDPIFFVDKSLL